MQKSGKKPIALKKSISYDGMDLTVDEANAYWQKYIGGGMNDKASAI